MLHLGPTSGDDELGVKAQHFERELDFVDHTLAGRLSFGPEFEVVRSVVRPLAVFMVRRFFWAKRAADHLRHHLAMLERFLLPADTDADISRSMVDMAFGIARSPFAVLVAALSGTEPRGIVKSQFATALEPVAPSLSDDPAPFTSVCRPIRDRSPSRAFQRTKSLIGSTLPSVQFSAAILTVRYPVHSLTPLACVKRTLLEFAGKVYPIPFRYKGV